ncbi:MAG: GH39 family glycosyl hydrolase [Myxococcota bacterium]
MFAAVVAVTLAAAPTVFMNGHVPSAADSQSMAALGASGVRMDFNWFDFEPQQGRFEWGVLDAAVDGARANGLRVFATVAYTPQWASSVASCTPFASTDAAKCENKVPDVAAWRAAVTAVVTRYRGRVECWGIWNEPNLRTFFDGTMDAYVDSVFLPAAAAIRAADPQARICGPELAGLAASSQWNGDQGTCAFGGCIRNGWERDLGQLLERIGPHLDVITQHVYKGDAAGVMQMLLDGETSFGVLTHDAVKNVIASKGYAGREFWLTEVGWEHPPQGSTQLADVATRIVDLYTKQEEVCGGRYAASLNDPWPNWTRTYYFHFPYDPGSGWGLVGPNQTALAPYSALQNWAANRTTTSCAGPDAGVVVADAGVDAGTPVVDAGQVTPPDAGLPDAGPVEERDAGAMSGVDAGAPSGVDAGAPAVATDAGADPEMPPASGGCGCTTVDPLALVALLAALRRR